MSAPDPDPLAGLDPVRFAAALSVLPIDHPLVVAASLAVDTAHTRHDRRVALREASHDVSSAADWTRIAADQITHNELQARRAVPAYPTDRTAVKEPAMTEQDPWEALNETQGKPWDPADDAACDAACAAYWDGGSDSPPPDSSTPDAPAAASPRRRDAGPEVVGLVCPECEEDVVDRPPTTLVPYDAHGAERPAYSHVDGEPLCPVMGPRGYQPAEPMEVHAEAAVEQAHRAVTEVPSAQARGVGEQAHREQLARWDAQSPAVVDDGPAAGAW